MTKVVYNSCFGGFGLSRKATERLAQLGMKEATEALSDDEKHPSVFGFSFSAYGVPRHDPLLVQVVEELGDEANAAFAELAIEEISGTKYNIDEYDGNESVQTPRNMKWITLKK